MLGIILFELNIDPHHTLGQYHNFLQDKMTFTNIHVIKTILKDVF